MAAIGVEETRSPDILSVSFRRTADLRDFKLQTKESPHEAG
jgi:hypothetical protein